MLGIDGIAKLATGIIDRVWANPNETEKVKLEALKIAMTSELAIHATNQEEAKHGSIFVAGWRPAVGWVCTAGVAYAFLLRPFLVWMSLNAGWEVPPELDVFHLIGLLTGMLGFGAYRSYEKQKEKSRSFL
jgi:hypothetical protein